MSPADLAGREAVLLVAHGSADPQAASTTRALAAELARARPEMVVRTAYLDHTDPRPDDELVALAGAGVVGVTVVPLLLTAAYHHRVDLPAMLTAAEERGTLPPVRVSAVLGPVAGTVPHWLLGGLRRRLAESLAGSAGVDGLVLAAAGTKDAGARATVESAATVLGDALGLPCVAAYASAAAPDPGTAVRTLRAQGATRVGVAAYFLATGRLYRAAAQGARTAGAVAVAEPLGTAPELVRLIMSRLDDLHAGVASPERLSLGVDLLVTA
ncbi:cobalamin biosynthesis protein CbiX [Natronosporangium hydrolyticum]|uniref:Cobalamin biosynthesis protein CbiX n=1 Tax=Natronosporangium hydrolyticum TaxID=2811111 RepID=A0A895YP20_9ACTN|nr:CbiX/SirB N-terminal domain-containing protein [Natronosporangium hydrolyticum]QSB15698.1 cobalamin biosynthesis protein CbiX [Natronosporangium hydrolyticum]